MIVTILSTFGAFLLLASLAVIGFALIAIFLVHRRSGKNGHESNFRLNLHHKMYKSDDDPSAIPHNRILQIPDLDVEPTVLRARENILPIPSAAQRPIAVVDDSILDVTGQTAETLPANEYSGLTKYPLGVPFWQHHYVYSASEIQRASKDQSAFYFSFRNTFVNGTYFDLEGNTNYAFILLFDLVESYAPHDDLATLEGHLDKLGELYPKTKPYIRSSLFRRLAEIGDSVGMERLRSQQAEFHPTRSNFDYEYWRFGSKHKKRLSLNDDEVRILNRLSYPSNNFLEIQFCCDQVIRLFLSTVTELGAAYEQEGTSFDTRLAEISDVVARKHFGYRQNSSNYRYCIQSTSDEICTLIFRYCENAVREHFGHKRKLNTDLYYSDVAKAEIHEKLISKVANIISSALERVKPPDEAAEIELNAQNTNRWKIAFQKLTSGDPNGGIFVENVLRLGELNRRNPSIENIYFEGSKFASKIDKQSALGLYIYYLYYDLRSAKFDNKKLTKTIQKNLFSNNEQLHAFEKTISDLITNKDLNKALASVADFYVQKRKQITLSREAIQEARHKHSDTVDLLNEYLHDEFEDDQNAIVAEEITGGELRIEITPKVAVAITAPSVSIVDLSPTQFELLQLFAKSSFSVPQTDVEAFARANGLFRNQLVESVNEICYEILDDVLIEEEDEYYVVSENYYRMIVQT